MKPFKTTKDCKDFPGTTRKTYIVLNSRFGNNIRVSDIFELWRLAFRIDEFTLLDERMIQNGEFQAYVMDKIIAWNRGEEIDMNEIYQKILETGEFSQTELRIFESGEPEYRIWAIILAITDPNNTNNITYN